MKKRDRNLVLCKETVRTLELQDTKGGTGPTWSCGLTTCGGPENPCMEMFASERNC